MGKLRERYSVVASTLALIVALTGAGAYAVDALNKNSVGSKQIRKNAVRGPELAKSAVKGRDLARRAVTKPKIADGAVTGASLDLPAPHTFPPVGEVAAPSGHGYAKLTTIGTYEKIDPSSVLHVSLTGVIDADFAPCVFQLRVGGQVGQVGAEVFTDGTESASIEALFSGLAPGLHEIEIWARTSRDVGEARYPCAISPGSVGISTTVIVEEVVV